MLHRLLKKSLSVWVTLEYVISGRVPQKLSKESQPMAPYLFFRLISYYGISDGSSKLTGKTNLFVNGFSRFVVLFGLGMQKYYVLAISVSNFSRLNAFLLSILITFPVRFERGVNYF